MGQAESLSDVDITTDANGHSTTSAPSNATGGGPDDKNKKPKENKKKETSQQAPSKLPIGKLDAKMPAKSTDKASVSNQARLNRVEKTARLVNRLGIPHPSVIIFASGTSIYDAATSKINPNDQNICFLDLGGDNDLLPGLTLNYGAQSGATDNVDLSKSGDELEQIESDRPEVDHFGNKFKPNTEYFHYPDGPINAEGLVDADYSTLTGPNGHVIDTVRKNPKTNKYDTTHRK